MKYLKYFEEASAYEAYKNGSNYVLPNVSYVEESDSVDFNPYIPVPQKAGDIVYYVNGSLKTIGYADWKNDLGTPIGVITIPKGFAPDGKARMVALAGQVGVTWCTTDTNETETILTNYTKVPITLNNSSTSNRSNTTGYLPSDNFTGATSYVDSVTKYSKTDNLIPSPYAGDAPNPAYYAEISGYNNALSDFSGLENTKTLVELDSTSYHAASYCWTYSDGVSDVQWYLPAMGELGYIMPRFNEINAGLAAVSGVMLTDSSLSYWSSSENAAAQVYCMMLSNGYVNNNPKYRSGYRRPWAIVE